MTILRVAGLTHRYGERVVLDDVSFELAAGEVVAIIGPSGAGKTTLFRCITRLVTPDQGVVELGGQDLGALTGAELRRARRSSAPVRAPRSWPPSSTTPWSGVTSRVMQRNRVVLPAPLGPMMATTSPAASSNDTSSRTTRSP